jgi:hypothetical protein
MNIQIIEPWVGENYENPRILPYRTLIVGESNYTDNPNQFTPHIVINCVGDDLTGDDPSGFGRFATKLRRIIFGVEHDMGPACFWPHVAFYNFVQYLVGDAARQRPTQEMWRASVPAFGQVIEKLNPERILVLGLENWRNLLQSVPHQMVSEYQAKIEVGNKVILAGYVFHPSSSLKYSDWNPIAQELLLKK